MVLRYLLLITAILFFAPPVFAQKPTCKSLHTGTFKISDKESGTTFIKRTENEQIEKNDDLGYELVLSITWLDECTYELRPKKLIKGDPAIMGDGTHVLKTRIKSINENSYMAESSFNFAPGKVELLVEILR